MRYNMENCRRYKGKRDLFLSRNYARMVYYLFVYLNDEYASTAESYKHANTKQNKSKK